MTSECFGFNPSRRTDFLKVKAQCESNCLLTYLSLSSVLELSFPEPLPVKILLVPERYYPHVYCYLFTRIQT